MKNAVSNNTEIHIEHALFGLMRERDYRHILLRRIFSRAAIFNVYMSWLDGGFAEPLDEVTRVLTVPINIPIESSEKRRENFLAVFPTRPKVYSDIKLRFFLISYGIHPKVSFCFWYMGSEAARR